MSLLVLGSVGFVSGKAKCAICGAAEIELKKCAEGKIKDTEGSAMSVDLLVVRLKYGLYVGHPSNGLSLVLCLNFGRSVVFGTVVLPLAIAPAARRSRGIDVVFARPAE